MQLKPKLVINSSEKILNFITFILPIDVHRYRKNEWKNTCTIHYSLMYIFMNLSVKFVTAHIFAWLLNFVFCSHPKLSLRNQWQVSEYIKHFITYLIEFIETNEKYARMDMMVVNIAKKIQYKPSLSIDLLIITPCIYMYASINWKAWKCVSKKNYVL